MRQPVLLLPVAFVVFGVVWGAWQAVLPDLADTFGLSTGPLGLILTAGFAASVPLMLATGRLLDTVGVGRGMAITATGLAAGLALVGTLASLPVLVLGVMLFAAGSGAFDVAVNGAALADERWSRPVRLTLLHAAFSAGGAAGALGGGALLAAGASFQLAYPALAAAVLFVAALSARTPRTTVGAGGAVPRAVALAMLPLAALAALAFLVEGSMETWSAIYLRDVLGSAAFVGALGPGAFHAAMLVGRLVGAGIAGSLGASATLGISGAMTVAGMGIALGITAPVPAIAGTAIAALGASFVVPVVVSLAGRRAGAYAGRAASYMLSLGYAGFLIGPSLVGLLGELAGLRAALAVIPLAAGVVALASRTRVVRG
jgi:fucose permease